MLPWNGLGRARAGGLIVASLAMLLVYHAVLRTERDPVSSTHIVGGLSGLRKESSFGHHQDASTTAAHSDSIGKGGENLTIVRVIEVRTKAPVKEIPSKAAPPKAAVPSKTALPSSSSQAVGMFSLPPRFPPRAVALDCKACMRYGQRMMTRTCLPAPCPAFPATGKRIVSTSLYGSEKRYTDGAIRNAELTSTVFPGWQLRFYIRADVPPEVQTEMRLLGADLQILGDTASVGFGMNWRFLVAEDPSVDAFVSRDCDSRLSLRDRYAVEDWIKGGKPFHVVRDHPSHAALAIMGGTWGARNSIWAPPPNGTGVSLKSRLHNFVAKTGNGDYLADINFLVGDVWPLYVSHGAAQHDSHSCDRWGGGKPFPRPRAGTEHVGAVYLWDGEGRESARNGDLALLIGNLGSAGCMPEGWAGAERKALTLTAAMLDANAVAPGLLQSCDAGGDELTSGVSGKYGCMTSWAQASGMCNKHGQVRVLHWKDSFIDTILQPLSSSAGSVPYTSLFTYTRHTFAGAGTSLPPAPLQYHERMSGSIEPIQALDGGVRYYPTMAIIDAPWVYGNADEDQAKAFSMEDLPRLLQVAGPETLVLMPAQAAQAVRRALATMSAADVPTDLQAIFSPLALAAHIIDHQVGVGRDFRRETGYWTVDDDEVVYSLPTRANSETKVAAQVFYGTYGAHLKRAVSYTLACLTDGGAVGSDAAFGSTSGPVVLAVRVCLQRVGPVNYQTNVDYRFFR